MGSKNWSKVDSTPLVGADLVVIPDRDAARKRWAHDVLAALDGKAKSVVVALPKVGKDVADHIAAGHLLDDLEPVSVDVEQETPARRVVLTPAANIHPRRVRWAWQGRVALGTLALLAGPEGLGKSTWPTGSLPELRVASCRVSTYGKPKLCWSAPPKIPGCTPSCPG
jgi:hypothetical protein